MVLVLSLRGKGGKRERGKGGKGGEKYKQDQYHK